MIYMLAEEWKAKFGNLFQDNMWEVWKSSQMDKYRKYNDFEKCKNCELLRFCRGCPAVSYGYTHNMYSKDPQCWRNE